MTATWFDNQLRLTSLEAVAESWIGTPFSPNGNAKGKSGGVSCQNLAAAIYREVGLCDAQPPAAPMGHAKHSNISLIAIFMAERAEFMEIPLGNSILPGDMIGFLIFRTVHHCGVAVSGGRFVHACDGADVKYSSLSDPTWAWRIARIWRPKP